MVSASNFSSTTFLIQQMDQGVICAFKARYTCNSLQHLVREMNVDEDFSLKEYYWKTFTIASCLSIIRQSLKDMKKETLNSCWKKLWPDCVNNYKDFSPEEVQQSAINRAVILVQQLEGDSFEELTEVSLFIDGHSVPLTD